MATKTAGATRKARQGDVTVVVDPSTGTSSNNITTTTTMAMTTTTTTTQKVGGVSRLPVIKERRPSVQRKAKTVSVVEASNDTTTTTNFLQRQESTGTTSTTTSTLSTPQRRASVPIGPGTPSTPATPRSSRYTFAGIGRRVSSMVRCRMAFQNRRKSSNPEDEPNHMEHIHEMPRNPRFSTFLSAEAQYAMMKGYEDKLYEKIANTNPESRLVLKRNNTPYHKKIRIVDNDAKKEGGEDRSESGERNSLAASSRYDTQDSAASVTTRGTTPYPTSISPSSDDGGGSSTTEVSSSITTTTSALRSPFSQKGHSQSVMTSNLVRSVTSTSSHNMGGVGFALHRSSSLPILNEGLSHKKRLVLTYRLESAMDILDTLKRRNKENSLSPRVFRIPRQVDAVRDFNSWAKVWNKEFKVVQAK